MQKLRFLNRDERLYRDDGKKLPIQHIHQARYQLLA